MAKQKYYVVWTGREPGVFTTWAECQAQVRGFAGAKFKAYPSRAEAERAFIESHDEQVYAKAGVSNRSDTSDQAPASRSDAAKPVRSPHARALARGEHVLYTDGGADPNPGPGGYGVVLLHGDERQEFAGGYRVTTNNRMELMGWIVGLKQTPEDAEVAVFSDSRYVGDMFAKGFAHGWRQRGWRTSGKKPAANADLWSTLLGLTDARRVTFTHVQAHTGIPENERCDELASEALLSHGDAADAAYERKETTAGDGGLFGG